MSSPHSVQPSPHEPEAETQGQLSQCLRVNIYFRNGILKSVSPPFLKPVGHTTHERVHIFSEGFELRNKV